MKLRRTLLVCIAVSFAAIDLVHKSFAPAEFHHARTPFVALIMGAVIAALVASYRACRRTQLQSVRGSRAVVHSGI